MIRFLVIFFAASMVMGDFVSGQTESSTGAEQSYPDRPVKVVVPFGAGGGSDTFVRILQKAIEENELLEHSMVIINVPGAGGTIGSRQVLESEPDGYTLMCLHDGIMSAKYADKTDYGPEAFAAIAGTGEVGSVIAVAGDSKYADLSELLQDASDRPEEVVFSANIGAPSHFVGLMLENAKSGARFRYTQTGGGAKRFAALAGGHIDVSAFSLAEYMQFKSAGLRALAFCGESRHPSAQDVPTAVEQGYDVVTSIMQCWWAPKDTPPERIRVISDVLEKAMETQQVKDALQSIHTDNVFLTGEPLHISLAQRESRFANVGQRELTQLPNFPALVSGFVLALVLVVAFQSLTGKDEAKQQDASTQKSVETEYRLRPWFAVATLIGTGVYVLAMQMNWAGFRVSTFLFILGLGMILTGLKAKQVPVLIAIALLMSVGLHFVFTNVFSIVLP